MPAPLPPDVAESIRRLDAAATGWPEHLLLDWQKVRGFVRRKHGESQRMIPTAALVAQEIEQTRNHAQAAMDAMKGVFGSRAPDKDESEEP